jgi:hypothetical protein
MVGVAMISFFGHCRHSRAHFAALGVAFFRHPAAAIANRLACAGEIEIFHVFQRFAHD